MIMKQKILSILMTSVTTVAVFSAVIIANTCCPFVGYQEKEPDSVRSLRKF